MSLVIPFLRVLLLFVNVYDTFKTLRRPKSRSVHGRPSLKAATQRKRAMKGCLTVWIIWCCITTYDRTLDPVFAFIIPFHAEFKSVCLLFLLITRAKGAEPIYLHVVRPFLKPYTPAADAVLDVARILGDLTCGAAIIPLQLCYEWCKTTYDSFRMPHGSSFLHDENVATPGLHSTNGSRNGQQGLDNDALSSHSEYSQDVISQTEIRFPVTTMDARYTETNRRSVLSVQSRHIVGRNRGRNAYPHPTQSQAHTVSRGAGYSRSRVAARPTYPSRYRSPNSATGRSASNVQERHEIWIPPSSYVSDSDIPQLSTSGMLQVQEPQMQEPRVQEPRVEGPQDQALLEPRSQPSEETPTQPIEGTSSPQDIVQEMDWRSYPAFPSAYPPTPVHRSSTLSPPPLRPRSVGADDPTWRTYEPCAGAYPPTPVSHPVGLPNAGRSRPTSFAAVQEEGESVDEMEISATKDVRETNLDVNGSNEPDDTLSALSVQVATGVVSEKESSSSEDADDEFDLTLRTPLPPRVASTPSSTSTSSVDVSSSELTTADHDSSLRTRSTSGDSSSTSSSASVRTSSSTTGSTSDASVVGNKRTYRVWRGNQVVGIRTVPQESESFDEADYHPGTKDILDGVARSSASSDADNDNMPTDERVITGIKRRRVGTGRDGRSDNKTRGDPAHSRQRPGPMTRSSARLAASIAKPTVRSNSMASVGASSAGISADISIRGRAHRGRINPTSRR